MHQLFTVVYYSTSIPEVIITVGHQAFPFCLAHMTSHVSLRKAK